MVDFGITDYETYKKLIFTIHLIIFINEDGILCFDKME